MLSSKNPVRSLIILFTVNILAVTQLSALNVSISNFLGNTPLPMPEGITATANGTQSGRLTRWGAPDTCSVRQTVDPWLIGTTYMYEAYTFTAEATMCMDIVTTVTEVGNYVALYEGNYYPYDFLVNCRGQQGSSNPNTFSAEVVQGRTYVLVVMQSNDFFGNYTVEFSNVKEPIPDPVQQDYYTSDRANNETPVNVEIDPNNILTDGSESFAFSGTPPLLLAINNGWVSGYLHNLGNQSFVIEGTDGYNSITHKFDFNVVMATLSPVIEGVVMNDVVYPTVITKEPTHGTPAESELVNLVTVAGDETTISFQWDFIKDPVSYKMLRGDLPEGMWFDDSTGTAIGTPTEIGEFIFVVSVKDWRGRAYQWVRLVVGETPAEESSIPAPETNRATADDVSG